MAEEGRDSPAGAQVGQVRSEGQRARRAELAAQRRALAAACRRRGWQLVEVVEEAGRSSKERKRPGSEQALPGRGRAETQALLAAKQDTLPPQAMLDLAALLARAQEQGFALVALDCALAPTRPSGEASANVLATFAPCERELRSRRIREALARKRAAGVRLGRPPSISPYALERIRRERKAGKSLTAIADGLNADRVPTAQGGRPLVFVHRPLHAQPNKLTLSLRTQGRRA